MKLIANSVIKMDIAIDVKRLSKKDISDEDRKALTDEYKHVLEQGVKDTLLRFVPPEDYTLTVEVNKFCLEDTDED